MANEENEDGSEKSEEPTSRRRSKSREKGGVAKSKEINSAAILFFFLVITAIYGPVLMQSFESLIRHVFLNFTKWDINKSTVQGYYIVGILYFLKLLAPFFITLIVVSLVSSIAQFGWLWTTKTVFQGFKNFSLNPTKMLGRIFGKNNWVLLGINLLKILLLVMVIYWTLKDELWRVPYLIELPLIDAFQYAFDVIFWLSIRVCLLLILIATIDFLWEKHKLERSLKMTKLEVKEERKQIEGDPQVRARVRGVMMKAAMDRMMQAVPEADVVITNPVHVAVAIKYDRENMAAPEVIAKGARLIAEKIKDIAMQASIPIVEKPPLARKLYKTVQVGQQIPKDVYQAVAEVLAYVYQINKKRQQRAAI